MTTFPYYFAAASSSLFSFSAATTAEKKFYTIKMNLSDAGGDFDNSDDV